MTVRNEEKKAFRNLTPEERSEIVEAWLRGDAQYLDVCEFEGGQWVDAPNVIANCYVYRTRPRQLVIPWEVIKPEFKWAAMDKNGRIWAYSGLPVREHEVWNGECDLESLNALVIDTTGIDWRESLTERPD